MTPTQSHISPTILAYEDNCAGPDTNQAEVQGYLAHKKLSPPRTLQWAYAQGPTVVIWGGHFIMSEVPLDSSASLLNPPFSSRHAGYAVHIRQLQGYLAHKKPQPPRTLQ